ARALSTTPPPGPCSTVTRPRRPVGRGAGGTEVVDGRSVFVVRVGRAVRIAERLTRWTEWRGGASTPVAVVWSTAPAWLISAARASALPAPRPAADTS